MKKIAYLFSFFVLLALSLPFLAQAVDQPKDFKGVINNVFIDGLLRPIVPLLIGLGVVLFIYGVLTTMLSNGGEKKEEGKQYMLWGIIGIFVMVSVWGLVAIVQKTFNLGNTSQQIKMEVPRVQISIE